MAAISLVVFLNTDGAYKRVSEYLLGGSFEGGAAVWVSLAAVVAFTAFAAWRFGHEEL